MKKGDIVKDTRNPNRYGIIITDEDEDGDIGMRYGSYDTVMAQKSKDENCWRQNLNTGWFCVKYLEIIGNVYINTLSSNYDSFDFLKCSSNETNRINRRAQKDDLDEETPWL